MNWKSKFVVGLFAALCTASVANADVKRHRVFSDHMVLQRDMNVNVWGWGAPGEKVSVQFDGQSLSAVTDDKGKWSVKLAPMKANTTPQNLTVTGKNMRESMTFVLPSRATVRSWCE
jgi:sialate O-acetylesterase